jgi:cytochrome oxidase assembly protein ShyY1
MYRFALRPRWLLAHAAILAFAVACLFLGRWQLHRLAAKRAHNRIVREREALAEAPLGALLPLRPSDAYRHVSLDGIYDAAHQTILVGREQDGRPGDHVLTPIRPAGLLVDRGWVPLSEDPLATSDVAPPSGPVHVEGVLLPSEHGLGSSLSTSEPPTVARVNLAAIQRRTGYPLLPLYLLLRAQRPPQAAPAVAALAPLTEGPHFSYAVQWFLFGSVALVGWAFFLRHAAREEARRAPAGTEDAAGVR